MPRADRVHVFAEWCDGPRAGVADFQGTPHLFVSDFADADDNPTEESSLLIPLAADEAQQFVRDLVAAGGAWSQCGDVAYRDSSGTLYPPWDISDQKSYQVAAQRFREAWDNFRDKHVSQTRSCLLARGEFHASHVIPENAVEDDADDRLPLEVRWCVITPSVGRDAIEAATRRWESLREEALEESDSTGSGEEQPF